MAAPLLAKAALTAATSKNGRLVLGGLALMVLAAFGAIMMLPVLMLNVLTPSPGAMSQLYCSAAVGAQNTARAGSMTDAQRALAETIRMAAISASTNPKAALAALSAAYVASGMTLDTIVSGNGSGAAGRPVGVYRRTSDQGWGSAVELADPATATVRILLGNGPERPGVLSDPAWAGQPTTAWLAGIGVEGSPELITQSQDLAAAFLIAADPSLTPATLGTGALCGKLAMSGDEQALAAALVPLIDSGKLTGSDGITQIRALAAGTASGQCHIDVRILQLLTVVVNSFDTVAVSDINRFCTGSLEGAGTNSSHYAKGGGRAIDFYALDGRSLTGTDAASRRLLEVLDPMMPAGSRVGQSQCRAGNPLRLTVFQQFADSCDHVHIDVHYAEGGLN